MAEWIGRLGRSALALLLVPAFYGVWRTAVSPALGIRGRPAVVGAQTVRLVDTARKSPRAAGAGPASESIPIEPRRRFPARRAAPAPVARSTTHRRRRAAGLAPPRAAVVPPPVSPPAERTPLPPVEPSSVPAAPAAPSPPAAPGPPDLPPPPPLPVPEALPTAPELPPVDTPLPPLPQTPEPPAPNDLGGLLPQTP